MVVKDFYLNETEVTIYDGNAVARGRVDTNGARDYALCSDIDLCLMGNYGNNDVIWESSNPLVATVEDGQIFAQGYGIATITATCLGRTYECKVYVKEIRSYFWIELDDAKSSLKSYWSYDHTFAAVEDSKIKYKLVEIEYNENGEKVYEEDITTQVNFTVYDPKVFKIEHKKGVVTVLSETTDGSFDGADTRYFAYLSTHDIYSEGDNQESISEYQKHFQAVRLTIFSRKIEDALRNIYVEPNSEYTVSVDDSIELHIKGVEDVGSFDGTDVFISGDISYFLATADKFKSYSSDETVLQLVASYGPTGTAIEDYDSTDPSAVRGAIHYLGNVEYKALKQGKATITFKYGDLIVKEIEVTVE